MKKVGIIGGSGFIGSYVTQEFLNNNYQVKVSTRDLNKKEKYEHLLALPHAENLEIAALDVRDMEATKDFVQGCNVLVHGGTPFQLDVEDPQADLMEPTVKGTENFLRAISEVDGLEKVIFIASVAAYNAAFPMPAPNRAPKSVFTEDDTPFMDENCHPYAQAKQIADQTVRRYVADHPDQSFEIVSVSPTFVVGRPLSGRQDSTSVGMQYLFKNKIAPSPFVQMMFDQDVAFAMVDVQDVAECVYRSATRSGLHGKNYLLSSDSYRISDISRMLNQQAPAGDPFIAYSNALAKQDLGVDFNPPRVPLEAYGNMEVA